MTNWKKYKFSDFVNINPYVKMSGNGLVSYVEMKDLNEGNKYCYPSDNRDSSNGSRFQNNDTLFARITPCLENGKICQVKNLKNGSGFGSTEFLVFRGKVNLSDTDFVYYLSRWDKVRSHAVLSMTGTSGRQRVQKSAFDELEILLPPLPEQRAIASVLSSLDDKIELNRRQNETLEKIAQAIFKHWFVDFNFPNEKDKPYKDSSGEMIESELGLIPKGWSVEGLENIADFLNGLPLQKYPAKQTGKFLPVIKIRELKSGISESTDKASMDIDSNYIVNDGDVIFSWSGSLEVVIWCDGKGALNQHLFKVTSQKYPKWFYYLWTKEHLATFQNIAANKATTMGHIQRRHLEEAKVLIPNEKNFSFFNLTFSPLIDKFIVNNIQNRTLSQLRDELLPKLMSGKVRVKGVNL
jgi:type I restriction enzyme S subunit